jgi:hypothetical protein
VVIPAGFSLINDINSREIIFIKSRVGVKNYYFGKIISAFLMTFLIFTVPFLIEIGLNMLAFPLSATGDPSNQPEYLMIYAIKNYMFSDIYLQYPYLYAAIMVTFIGAVSGALGVFVVAISTFLSKFKAFVFIPVYVLLYVLINVGEVTGFGKFDTSYYFIFSFYDSGPKSEIAYFSFLAGLVILSSALLIGKGTSKKVIN